MTHNFTDFSVKVLTDDHGQRWYLFFRSSVIDPFLALPEFEMDRVVKMFEHYQEQEAKQL